MTLAALDGVRLLGLDTAPLIYLIEQHPTFGGPVLEVARRLDDPSQRGDFAGLGVDQSQGGGEFVFLIRKVGGGWHGPGDE